MSSNGIFLAQTASMSKLRGLNKQKTNLLLENDAKMTIFFQDRLKCFWSCFPLGPVLPYSLHSIKLPKNSHFFFEWTTKNLSNEGWMTWQWHVIDFFYHRSICLQDNYFRQFYQILTILHIKNLSRKEIIVHSIVLP